MVWLRRIKRGGNQIGHAVAINSQTRLIQVVNDIDYEWLLRSGRWEVDDRVRCPACTDLVPDGARHCITCGYLIDGDQPLPELVETAATGATQRL